MKSPWHKYPFLGAALALSLLAGIWGYNWVIMKLALRDAGPFDFAALRTLLGALSLFAVSAVLRRPLKPVNVRALCLLGLLQTTAFMGLSVWALEAGGAGKTAVLVYTMPFWVLLLAWPALGERLQGLQWLAVCVALTGLALLLQPWHLHGSLLSKLLAVLAGIFWAASAIVVKRLHQRQDYDLLSLTAWQMLFGAIPLSVIALSVASPSIHWSGYFIIALAYNALLGSALAWLLWLYVLHRLPAGAASLGTLATPVVGVLAASLQLQEQPSTLEVTGMLLIGLALALISAQALRQHRRVNPAMGQE